MAFVIYMKVNLCDIDCDCSVVLSFLELLAWQQVSAHMIANHVAAIKYKIHNGCCMYWILDDPRIKYFIKSLKVNRPLSIQWRNIIDISTMRNLVLLCDNIHMASVFKAIVLTGFLASSASQTLPLTLH